MISIIIPVYNEEKVIDSLLEFINTEISEYVAEIIVSDGGSTDQTHQICKKYGVKFISSPQKGRAAQLNFGAHHSSGDILYFLHADTFPPKGFIKDIQRMVEKGYGAGCYRLNFDSNNRVLRFYSWFTRFNVTVFRFGDQSLFITRSLFDRVGGYNEDLMVMEDQEIVRRLKSRAQFRVMKSSVVTSSRKYRQIGVFKLQLIFCIIVTLYYLNVSQHTIKHFYFSNLCSDQ